MRAEDLKERLLEAMQEKNLERRRRQLLVKIIQRTFKDGVVPDKLTWVTILFLPKGRGGVFGDRSCGGSLEGLLIGGKLWAKTERDPT